MRLTRIGGGLVILSVLATLARGGTGNPKNGLSSRAFRDNILTRSPEALELLKRGALNGDLLTNTRLQLYLRDPHARAVAEELVRCALRPGTTVTYVDRSDPSNHRTYTWEGEMGLCQSGTAGSWTEGAPTEMCQQLVTACIMARVNSLGMAVPISLRGRPADLFPADDPVSTEPTLRESPADEDPAEGTLMRSFETSCGGRDASGRPVPATACNWISKYVGTCREATVQLALGPSQRQPRLLRVCSGIHGCEAGDALPGAQLRYRRIDIRLDPQTGVVTFPCPAEAPDRGYYSVMVYGLQKQLTIEKRGGAGSYPATRREVFTFREGAFYGNLFETDELRNAKRDCWLAPDGNRVCSSTDPKAPLFPYTNVHVCYSPELHEDGQQGNLGVAYLNRRMCALPGAKCFYDTDTPKPCSAVCEPVSGADMFKNCKDPSGKTFQAITTFLNEPCDLIGEGDECNRLRKKHSSARSPSPDQGHAADQQPGSGERSGPGKRSSGGCSRCSAGGAAPIATGAATLALLLLRRRRLRRA